jgi:probable phosphoglycerate mutase
MNNLLSPPFIFPTSSPSSISSTKVILVRHARTTYNEQGRYQGSSDRSVLTAKGHQDAYATGLALQQYDFDVIYTSPLKRVQQTTQEIVSAFNSPKIPVSIEPKLTEVCMSDWQGLSYQEVKDKYPDAYTCWQNTPHLFSRDHFNYPVLELFERVKVFWQKILHKHRGQTILIVAHGGTNRALIGTAISLSPKHYHSLQQCNCGISCLEFSSFSNIGKVKYLNVTNHLGKKLPKLKAGKTGWRWLLLSNEVIKEQFKFSYFRQLFLDDDIDLVLTDSTQKSEALANNLLTSDFSALHISIDKINFLDSWQKTFIKKQQINNNSPILALFTGLIIVSNKLQSQILSQTIEIKPSLELTNSLAVVHYPHLERRSILQGIIPLRLNLNANIKLVESRREVGLIKR